MLKRVESCLVKLRQHKPLVLCLTNQVTMDFMANVLLALGATPLMSSDPRETEELVNLSQAITINIGTLSSKFIEQCGVMVNAARYYHKPIVLDPVGAGASQLRTNTARSLMSSVDIIRGNASEIMSLCSDSSYTRGVESTLTVGSVQNTAVQLAQQLGRTIVVSGPEDFITDGTRQELLHWGSPLMSHITGMGCALTAVIAAFNAIVPDAFEASLMATFYFGRCGSFAEKKTFSPGTFRTAFIDALYEADFLIPEERSHAVEQDLSGNPVGLIFLE